MDIARQFGWMHIIEYRPRHEHITHVVPINDTYTHDTTDCWCCPLDDGFEMIHNAADNREYYETGVRKPH